MHKTNSVRFYGLYCISGLILSMLPFCYYLFSTEELRYRGIKLPAQENL